MVRRRTIAKLTPEMLVRTGTVEVESRKINEEWPKSESLQGGEWPYVGEFYFAVPYYGRIKMSMMTGYKKGFKWLFKDWSASDITGKQIQNLFNIELEEWGFNPEFVKICKKTLESGVYHGRMRTNSFTIDRGWPMLTDEDVQSAMQMFYETAKKYEYDPDNDPRALRKKVKEAFLSAPNLTLQVPGRYGKEDINSSPKLSTRFGKRNKVPNGLDRFVQIRPTLLDKKNQLEKVIENYNDSISVHLTELNEKIEEAYKEARVKFEKDQNAIIVKQQELKAAMDKIIKDEGL